MKDIFPSSFNKRLFVDQEIVFLHMICCKLFKDYLKTRINPKFVLNLNINPLFTPKMMKLPPLLFLLPKLLLLSAQSTFTEFEKIDPTKCC